MGKKIATLYAEITGDTTKLDKSLKDTKTNLGGIKGAASEMSASVNSKLMSMVAPAALVTGAYYGIKNAIAETVTYAKQVEDLGRLIGATPEEASHLIQAADDMRISYEDLTTAMEGAIRKGYDPSISGLEQIREKYQSLDDPIERSKFLMDTFGRSGAEMAILLEQPRDRLRELAEESDKVGLTMSGDNLKAAKDYALAMDGLEDSINGVKIKLGNELIPKLTWILDNGSAVENSIVKQKTKWLDLIPVLGSIRDLLLWINQLNGAGAPAGAGTRQEAIDAVNGVSRGIGSSGSPFAASGANFTVPPGYSGDSYGMRVQSGEKVKVTQAGVPDDTARMLRALPAQIGRAVRDGVVQGLAQ